MQSEKETGSKISYDEVAKAFQVSSETVRIKCDLLELPQEIQDKLHKGELTFEKARKLTILLREKSIPTTNVGGSFQEIPKTIPSFFYSFFSKSHVQEWHILTEKGYLN
jgi:hypothetical protein